MTILRLTVIYYGINLDPPKVGQKPRRRAILVRWLATPKVSLRCRRRHSASKQPFGPEFTTTVRTTSCLSIDPV